MDECLDEHEELDRWMTNTLSHDLELWKERAHQQATRGDMLEDMLTDVQDAISTPQGAEAADNLANEIIVMINRQSSIEFEWDDRLICDICERSGWPEDGFVSTDAPSEHDPSVKASFCPGHSDEMG